MRGRHQLFFGLRLVSKEFQHPAIQTKIEQHFGGFFYQIKVRQPIERQDSMQTVIRTSRRLDSFLREAAENFEVFSSFKYSRVKLKIKNTVDVLFKDYPMVPLSCRDILAGWHRYLSANYLYTYMYVQGVTLGLKCVLFPLSLGLVS
jgi:hypothetical protein